MHARQYAEDARRSWGARFFDKHRGVGLFQRREELEQVGDLESRGWPGGPRASDRPAGVSVTSDGATALVGACLHDDSVRRIFGHRALDDVAALHLNVVMTYRDRSRRWG